MCRIHIENHIFKKPGRFPFTDRDKIRELIINEVGKSRLIGFQKDGRERRLYGPRVYVTKYDSQTDTQHVITVLLVKSVFRNGTPEEKEAWVNGSKLVYCGNRESWCR